MRVDKLIWNYLREWLNTETNLFTCIVSMILNDKAEMKMSRTDDQKYEFYRVFH